MDDVWLHVFSRLPPSSLLQMEVVSSSWRALIAETIRKRAVLDMEKDFPGCEALPETMRQVIERHGPALLDVNIRIKPKTERCLQYVSGYHVTRRVVRSLRTTATRLRKLRIERMNLTIGAVEELAFLPESLQDLSIVNCSLSCNSPEIGLIAQNSFRVLFQRCKRLKKFELAWRGLCFEHFEVTDDLLSYLPDSVEELNISAGKSLKITSLDFLKRKRLCSLILQRSFISSLELKHLLPMADCLISLDLVSSINILDISLLGKLTNLRNLWLGNMREGVDDAGFLTILSSCQRLEWLCIENLLQLTEKSLSKLALLPNLRRLEAGGCRGFNDNCCFGLVRCQKLEYLDLNFCRNISADGLRSLLQIPSLIHLEIVGIPSFSPKLLIPFSQLPKEIICDNFSPNCSLVLPPIPQPA